VKGREEKEKKKFGKEKLGNTTRRVCVVYRSGFLYRGGPINREVVSFPHPTMSKFPEVQGGGSLIIAWQIKDKHVLVVGGGEVRDQH
jgi:hypothetical protein